MVKKAYILPVISDFFATYLPETKGLSVNTIRSYKNAFRLLLGYAHEELGLAPEKIEFRHLEKGFVLAWLKWLSESRGCSARTRNQRLAALVTFSRFALSENFEEALALCSDIERIPQKRTKARHEAVHFTRGEMSILLRLPDASYDIGKRDKVILSVLYATGARAQELCDITTGDVRFGMSTAITLHGKGNRTRTVVIPEQCAVLIKAYMEHKRLKGPQIKIEAGRHLFSSQTHEHMTISCLESIVKKYVNKAKDLRPDLFRSHYTPHTFRHSIAMHMLESGIPLPVIKTFLGHVSIATTMIYAAADFDMVSKYLRDKDPYADQENEFIEPQQLLMPQFLR